jgi:hypothetical protein
MSAIETSPISIAFGAGVSPETSPLEIAFDAPTVLPYIARRDIVACRIVRADSATIYVSDSRYISPSTDTPPQIAYLPRLTGDIEATRRIAIQPWGDAQPISTIGQIALIAIDGGVDDLLDPSWIGAQVQVRVGTSDQIWTDLTPALTGQLDQVVADGESRLKLTLVDPLAALAEAIGPARYSDAEPLEEVQGQRRPIALGDCFSCPIVRRSIDEEHDVHEDASYREVIRVREGGAVGNGDGLCDSAQGLAVLVGRGDVRTIPNRVTGISSHDIAFLRLRVCGLDVGCADFGTGHPLLIQANDGVPHLPRAETTLTQRVLLGLDACGLEVHLHRLLALERYATERILRDVNDGVHVGVDTVR